MFNFDISTPSAMTTTLRQIGNFVGGILVANGWASESSVQFWTGLVITVALAGYAVVKQVKMREAQG